MITINWGAAQFTDGAPITGYTASVACENQEDGSYITLAERTVSGDMRSVTFDVETDGLSDGVTTLTDSGTVCRYFYGLTAYSIYGTGTYAQGWFFDGFP
jgi:hypothetical protein